MGNFCLSLNKLGGVAPNRGPPAAQTAGSTVGDDEVTGPRQESCLNRKISHEAKSPGLGDRVGQREAVTAQAP